MQRTESLLTSPGEERTPSFSSQRKTNRAVKKNCELKTVKHFLL